MSDGSVTIQQLHEISGMGIRALQIRAGKENWSYIEVSGKGRGGKVRHFIISQLPEDIQLIYNKVQLQKQIEASPNPPATYKPASAPVEYSCTQPAVIGRAQQEKALTKYDLLRLYRERIRTAPYGQKTRVRDDFVAAYNTGLMYPKLFEQLGPVSWKTIEGWKRDVTCSGNDCYVLADRRGAWRRGQTSINAPHEKILLMCLLHPHAPRIAESIRVAREIMHQRGIENGFSDATYRRWIKEWRDRNYHIWTYTREGWKAWNDKCALSGERDYDQIEVGDLAVADGHTLNFEIINPWTGKPKRMTLVLWYDMKSSYPLGWEIMPTENTQAIAAALRWAILRLGKIPNIAYIDNGKAFGARFFEGIDLEQEAFTGLFERLGMQVIHARPYRGQSKTIERHFGAFSELERWAPTYTGTSIQTKPPGMMRGEKLHRRIRQQMIGGGITLEQAHLAVADWFDRYVRRPQQDGHLKGIAPLDVFMAGRGPGVDREQLNDLMMAIEVKSIRRSAISFNGRQYYHREFHGRTHKVMIKYDFQDPSYIRVHELTGELICVAEPYEKLHPAAGILGDDADRKRLSEHCAEHRHQEKEASAFASQFLREEFLPQHRKQMAAIGVDPLPLPEKGKATPDKGRHSKQLPEKSTISDEQWAEILASADQADVWIPEDQSECDLVALEQQARDNVVEDAVALRARLEAMPEPERYIALMEMEARCQIIPERWRDFMRYFQNTLEYLNSVDHYEQIRGQFAVQWQADGGALYQSNK